MDQTDLNAIIQTLAAENGADFGMTGAGTDQINKYDFARPENLPSEFTRALENVNTGVARALSGIFSSYSSAAVQVESISINQLSYRQYCQSLQDITAIGIFTIAPLDGSALFEMNAQLAWYILDRGLGGPGEVLDNPREFTMIERGLLDDLFRRILREIGKAWEALVPMRPSLRETTTNPTIVRTAHPDDRMVVCTFGAFLPEITGHCTYCIPVNALDFERLLNREQAWDADARELSLEQQGVQVVDNLQEVPLTLQACLRGVPLSFSEVSALRVGDIIEMDLKVTEPLELRIGNCTRFSVRPVTAGDTVAVEILSEGEEKEDAYA